MGKQRGGIILAIAMTVLLGGLVVIMSGPAQPAVVRELVALAPAGSKVTVSHSDKAPWGNYDAHWEWSFEAGDPPSAIAAYRA